MLMVLLTALDDPDDQRKFLKLHSNFEQKMFRVAMKILDDHAEAEDAVQESWVRIIGHFDEVKKVPWEKIESYITVTVKNVSLRMLHKRLPLDALPESYTVPDPSPDDPDELERLVEMIGSLPEKYRRVLEMKFVLEYSNTEISSLLNINASTVSTLASRGRKLLMDKLREEGYVDG